MAPITTRSAGLTLLLAALTLGSASAAGANDFVDTVAAANTAEIQASQALLQKTTFDDSKTLAHRLIDDHTALNAQLLALAQKLGISVPDDAALAARATKINGSPIKGMSPDASYAAAQVDLHKQAVALFTAESKSSDNEELKAFALQNLPMMEHHLKMATRLAKTHKK